ncbi:hypothetical protein MTR67_048322 [Solanum verrucosum]|uniref:Uncharacterized protein n=1 Tax=Solanum verrucosum TaxID=315347 RepID=A0AAF0UY81_SOLVR|nr:hypothetical protein MTR67_048322 [Solanum verrucosum]
MGISHSYEFGIMQT